MDKIKDNYKVNKFPKRCYTCCFAMHLDDNYLEVSCIEDKTNIQIIDYNGECDKYK